MNDQGNVSFLEGNDLVPKASAVYLGNCLHHKLDIKAEVNSRIGDVKRTWNKLKTMFKQNRHDRDKYWKHNVFNSVITAKLVYGLETAQLNDSILKMLDSFYIRSMRQIIGWQPTFLNRANTNKNVIDEITRIVNQCSKSKHGKYVFENISDRLKKKKSNF
jgi:hypothetical protein